MLRHNGFLKQVDTKDNNDGFLGMTNETEKEIGTSSKHVELASIKYHLIIHTEPSETQLGFGKFQRHQVDHRSPSCPLSGGELPL